MRHRYLLGCLILSGFSGLAYELLWTRLLSLAFGSTLLSFSTVIAVFFGGLALGAFLAGKRAETLARPIRTYAMIEIVTGVFGIGLHPLLDHLDELFAQIDPGAGLAGAAVRLAIATPLLLAPTVLMGATLPVISRAMIVHDDDVGRGTALIYGFNTLGAFLGVYVTTYHLLPAVGVLRACVVAAIVNLVAGGIALLGDKRATALPVRVPTIDGAGVATAALTGASQKTVTVTTVLAFLGGFAAIALQVVWVRIFSTFLDGTVYGVGAVLICVLVGITAGSLFIARVLRASAHPALWFTGLQLATIAAVLLTSDNLLWIGYQLRSFTWLKIPGLEGLHAQLGIVFVVLLVPTFCSGASFPTLVRITESRAASAGRAIGSLYAANTVGSILGSLVTGFVLLPSAGSEATMLAAITLSAMVAAIAGALLVPGQLRTAGLVAAVVALGAVTLYDGLDAKRLALPPQPGSYADFKASIERRLDTIVYHSEGDGATVLVVDEGKTRGLVLSGLGQGGRNQAPPHHVLESLLVGLVPAAHVSAPKRALVVGLGAGTTVDVLLRLGVPKIEVVELEPKVVEAVGLIFPEQSPVVDPRVHVTIGDARHHLLVRGANDPEPYDLITSMPAHPWVASSIFTQEFFEIARDNLSERGVFSSWFGTERMDRAAVESLFRAFTAVFPSYVIYRVPVVGAYYLVGAKDGLTLDLARFEELSRIPEVREYSSLADPYHLLQQVYASGDRDTPKPPAGIVNTDDSAYVELHAPRSSTTSPNLVGFLPKEHLVPTLVREDARRDVFTELFERHAGTPRSELPSMRAQVRADKAKRTFEAVRSSFSADEQAYFDGRLAILEGRADDARRLLDRAASLPEPWASRVKRARVLSFPRGSAEQLRALAELPPSTDVLAFALELDWAGTLARVPDEARDPSADPIGWLLGRMRAAPGSFTDADRAAMTAIGPHLSRTTSPAVLRACVELAAAQGLERERASCEQWRVILDRTTAANRVREARRAGGAGDFRTAARLLTEANALVPGDETTVQLLMRALVEVGDRDAIARLRSELAFSGKSERYVEHVLREAEAGKQAKKTIGEPQEPNTDDGR
ncbi:fused MFS/spermidine synthase [Myxococcota bacterium]|nr:fused MFS/spermidine synthase [Myxococcota bacterium]